MPNSRYLPLRGYVRLARTPRAAGKVSYPAFQSRQTLLSCRGRDYSAGDVELL